MTEYGELIRDLITPQHCAKNARELRLASVAAIRELVEERDEAVCLLTQARVEADGQRSRAEKAEAELAETKAVWLDAETRAQRAETELAATSVCPKGSGIFNHRAHGLVETAPGEFEEVCPTCEGKGMTIWSHTADECPDCGGTGKKENE